MWQNFQCATHSGGASGSPGAAREVPTRVLTVCLSPSGGLSGYISNCLNKQLIISVSKMFLSA